MLSTAHSVFPWSVSVCRCAGLIYDLTASVQIRTRQQRKVILVWLEPITYFRLQPTCPGTSWRNIRTSSHFSTGVCIYIFLSTDWNIEIEEQTVFNWRDGSGSISSSELGQVMRTFGWSPSEMELQVLCSQIYLDKPSSRLVSCNVLIMHNCTCRSLSVK